MIKTDKHILRGFFNANNFYDLLNTYLKLGIKIDRENKCNGTIIIIIIIMRHSFSTVILKCSD